MRHPWNRTALGVLALVLPPSLEGQDPVRSDTLLTRLTAEAVAANPGLASRRSLAAAATARIRPAGALPDPTLEAGVMDLVLPSFAFRRDNFTEVDLQLSQEFPWPGTLGARRAAARAAARARTAEVAARRRDVIVRTAELYYRLRYVVAARATLARQRALFATAVGISTSRYAATAAPESDPLQARVALARLDTEGAELAADEAELRARLKALRNVTGPDSLAVEPIRPEQVRAGLDLAVGTTPEARASPLGPDSLPEHPRLAARRADLEAAERTVRVEQLGARPDFTLMARYGARPIAADFFSAFVGVRLPLYAGRKQLRLADAARAEADAARAALAEEEAGLAEELRTVGARIASEAERLRLLRDQVVPSARATVDASLRVYRLGRADFQTVLATEDALYRAELDAARAAADYLAHRVMLEQLVAPEEAR